MAAPRCGWRLLHISLVVVTLMPLQHALALGRAATRTQRGDDSTTKLTKHEPLHVTPLLEHNLEDAREAMKVNGVTPHVSYAGFFNVANATASYESNMYVWFHPAQNQPPSAAAKTLVWLQGGPGASSLFGMFNELGPIRINEQMQVENMPYTWNDNFNLLFIDNPVGAGFSYTTADEGYCTTTRGCVSHNLYALLQQFVLVFPEVLKAELFITGESYGGHYVPAFASHIHQANIMIENEQHVFVPNLPTNAVRLPLAGAAIGDGWVDPVNMVGGYAELLHSLSLVNLEQRTRIESYQDSMLSSIFEERFYDAFCAWDEMLNGDVFPHPSYFHNITGSSNYDNVLKTEAPASFSYYNKFLASSEVRDAIHVGNAKWQSGAECEKHLLNDFMVSYVPELADLMESGYAVLVYSGQLDIIVASPLTERYLASIPWHGASDFAKSPRVVWRVSESDEEVAGFVQYAHTFTRAVVRSAGHILPFDQPRVAHDMITRWIEGTAPFAPRHPPRKTKTRQQPAPVIERAKQRSTTSERTSY